MAGKQIADALMGIFNMTVENKENEDTKMELRKCNCGFGNGILITSSQKNHYVQCSNSFGCRATTGYYVDQQEAIDAWNWMMSQTPKVTARCVDEIAAALPDGEVADGYHEITSKEIFLGTVDRVASCIMLDLGEDRIILQPKLLTGKAWANERLRAGMTFRYQKSVWHVFNAHGMFVRDALGEAETWFSNDKWHRWLDELDDLSDETVEIIFDPKKGE